MTHPESSLLSGHLDGDLAPPQARLVEEHISSCASCARLYRELQEVQLRARELPDRFPDRDLWPQIARSIRGRSRETDVIELHPWMEREQAVQKGGGFRISYLHAAAAVLALALFSGAAGAYLMAPHGAPGSSVAQVANPWVSMVEQASPGLDVPAREVARLEELLASHREELDPATVLILEKNLGVIDLAIRECVRALEVDPGNQFLESHLAQAVETKASFLREATAFVAPMS
jgi:anti-sigma factor RsiW